MPIFWTDQAWEEYLYWQSTDKKTLLKINNLIKSVQRTPYEGIGKPEPLKYELKGCWSRRINQQHRLVYELRDQQINIIACRYHY